MAHPAREHLEKVSEVFGLGRHLRALNDVYSPSIQLQLVDEDLAQIPLGETRVGGDPDLPEGTPWPQVQGRPLSFLAQLRLSEFHNLDEKRLLPRFGLVSFFFDLKSPVQGQSPEDAGRFQVHFVPDERTPLVRTQAPAGTSPRTLPPRSVEFLGRASLPPEESPEAQKLSLGVEDWDLYYQMIEALEGGDQPSPEPRHKVLGFADLLQGDLRLDCEMVRQGVDCRDAENFRGPQMEAYAKSLSDWQLFLQLDADESLGLLEAGQRLYFLVPQEALRKGRFEESWMVLQEEGYGDF